MLGTNRTPKASSRTSSSYLPRDKHVLKRLKSSKRLTITVRFCCRPRPHASHCCQGTSELWLKSKNARAAMNASSLASDCHHGTARKLAETDKVQCSCLRSQGWLGAGSWELRAGESPARQGSARFGSTKPLRGPFLGDVS